MGWPGGSGLGLDSAPQHVLPWGTRRMSACAGALVRRGQLPLEREAGVTEGRGQCPGSLVTTRQQAGSRAGSTGIKERRGSVPVCYTRERER